MLKLNMPDLSHSIEHVCAKTNVAAYKLNGMCPHLTPQLIIQDPWPWCHWSFKR